MQQQPSFVATHQMPLSLWSKCVAEQQTIYERAQREATKAWQDVMKQTDGTQAHRSAFKVYCYKLDTRNLERKALALLSSYYTH